MKSWGSALHGFLTVPMYAALISIVIAMIPPLQAGMKELKPVEQAIRSAGACSSELPFPRIGQTRMTEGGRMYKR